MDLTTSYKILGVDPKADAIHVKRAYKANVRRWHPDQFPEGSSLKASAEEQLKLINIAYARIRSHLDLHRPAPADKPTASAPSEPPPAASRPKATQEKKAQRSWMDHLFDTLNAFAGPRPQDARTDDSNQADTRRRRTFGQVLDEMTGGIDHAGGKQSDSGTRHAARRSYADIYKKYRRAGTRVGGVDPMEEKGPIKPVRRVRGIGRSR